VPSPGSSPMLPQAPVQPRRRRKPLAEEVKCLDFDRVDSPPSAELVHPTQNPRPPGRGGMRPTSSCGVLSRGLLPMRPNSRPSSSAASAAEDHEPHRASHRGHDCGLGFAASWGFALPEDVVQEAPRPPPAVARRSGSRGGRPDSSANAVDVIDLVDPPPVPSVALAPSASAPSLLGKARAMTSLPSKRARGVIYPAWDEAKPSMQVSLVSVMRDGCRFI
jgi:hypothetical protein